MQSVEVPLKERSYKILIGDRLLSKLGAECKKLHLGTRCAIISDSQVVSLHGEKAQQSLIKAGFEPVLIAFPSGENAKNLKTVQNCYDQLSQHRLERKSFIVALGGGVVGDLAGFVAATYLRGIDFVQVPTTLLAQVDSSVGGKVGVNLRSGKNLVGAFYQPRLVLCDLDVFSTLPDREFRSGLAEVIKYGIIHDKTFFISLERDMTQILQRKSSILAPMIARCCEIKAAVVGQDERESGLRAILNFGHTYGHAIETSLGYGRFLHGEAISIGQVAAGKLSVDLLGMPKDDLERIGNLLKAAGLPTSIQLNPAQRSKLLAAMKLDKKVSQGTIQFVLARTLGEVIAGVTATEDLIHEALKYVEITNISNLKI